MSMKIVPFRKSDKKQPDGPAMVSSGPKKSEDGDVVDHGYFDKLSYDIFKRGVIKISDQSGRVFKKDINLFETEVLKLDFTNISEGQKITINGSGDNDNLVFSRVDGDVVISLEKREFAAIEKLRNILSKGKEKLLG